VEGELRLLRIIRELSASGPLRVVPTLLGAHAVPVGSSAAEYAALVANELVPQVAAEGLAEYCDAFCEAGYFDVASVRKVMAAARAHGLQMRLHADQLSLCGGALLAAELHATTADHLECVDAEGISALVRAGVQPVLLPGSVYALGLRQYAPAREMIDAGLPVVLATDFNPGSSPTPSMPMVLSLACTQMKMTPAEAVCATTINAAWSLDRGLAIGSLERGKWADFSVFDCEDWREIVCVFGIEHAWRVFVGGSECFSRTHGL
jgi:imidazolonepropionase